jgi:type II secretory ATPase GspE/PulE/Tfp pilus assembly ATPase PilB-like protein
MSLDLQSLTPENKIASGTGGKYAVPERIHPYIALELPSGRCFLNPEYKNDADVVQVLSLWRAANLIQGVVIESSSAELVEKYSKVEKNNNNSTSTLQREIKEMFTVAATNNASDIHIMVRDNESLIKTRILGDLERTREFSSEHGNAICRTIYATMCDVADKNFQPRTAQNGRVRQLHLPSILTGVRIATTPTENGYYMVCRLLYKADDKDDRLAVLGYDDFHIKQLEELKAKKSGVIIISGPTGSGKSTTLQKLISASISENNGTIHVITVEDPPEYTIAGEEIVDKVVVNEFGQKINIKKSIKSFATQTPVTNAKGREKRSEKFNDAIAAALRLDPDVIMIGEVRDSASAEAALRASMTGHQVFTTIHANKALTIFPRLFDIGAKKELACDAAIVTGLIAQRLVKQLCTFCAVPLVGNESLLNDKGVSTIARLRIAFGATNQLCLDMVSLSGVRLRNHNGCNRCKKGIGGRTVVAEIIITDDKFMELSAEDKKSELRKYWMTELQGIDMLMHAVIKIKMGICDPLDIEKELGFIRFCKEVDWEYYLNLLTNSVDFNSRK